MIGRVSGTKLMGRMTGSSRTLRIAGAMEFLPTFQYDGQLLQLTTGPFVFNGPNPDGVTAPLTTSTTGITVVGSGTVYIRQLQITSQLITLSTAGLILGSANLYTCQINTAGQP